MTLKIAVYSKVLKVWKRRETHRIDTQNTDTGYRQTLIYTHRIHTQDSDTGYIHIHTIRSHRIQYIHTE